jgi:hypothetical protein
MENSFRGGTIFKLPAGGWNGFTIMFFIFSVYWSTVFYRMFISPETPSTVSYAFLPLGTLPFFVFLYSLAMRMEVSIEDDRLSVARVLFGLRISKSCAVADIKSIEQAIAYTRNHRPVFGLQVITNNSRVLKFGSNLLSDERVWLIQEINKAIAATSR